MYEVLISHLRDCAKYDQYENTFSEAADAIEALSSAGSIYGKAWTLGYDAGRDENSPRWISVTERLPEESWERVLAYTDDGTVMTLPAIKLRNGYVRYWMPLPEPPKEVVNGEITKEEASEQYNKAYADEYCNAHPFL